MAAKKTRKVKPKPAKKRGKGPSKPARRPAAKASARKAPARARARKKKVVKATARPKRRPAPKRRVAKKRPVAKRKPVRRKAQGARVQARRRTEKARRAPARATARRTVKSAKKSLVAKKKAAAAAKKLLAKKKTLKRSATRKRPAPSVKKSASAKKAAPTFKKKKKKAVAGKKSAPPPKKLAADKKSAPPPKKLAADKKSAPSPKRLAADKKSAPPPKKLATGKAARELEARALSGEAKRPLSETPSAESRKASSKERGAREGRIAPVREPAPRIVTLPLPIMQPPKRPSIEERSASIEIRLGSQADDFQRRYIDSFDMSWIYHDSALEGVVYTFEELRTALAGPAQPVTDSSLQPTYDDIRRHKEAIDFVRDFGTKKRLPVTLDVIKKIYLILHPEEGDIKTVKYRKDIPQHRLYFHEYAPPDKIAYKVRQIVDWLNDPETRKTRNGVRIAARAHYDLLRVYPFATDSGKVSRLFMNLLLMRTGLPPAIIHSTERQRYYEALKGSATIVLQMVQEAVENALSSVEKLLDEHETRKRAFVS
jgi:Fic family protein